MNGEHQCVKLDCLSLYARCSLATCFCHARGLLLSSSKKKSLVLPSIVVRTLIHYYLRGVKLGIDAKLGTQILKFLNPSKQHIKK